MGGVLKKSQFYPWTPPQGPRLIVEIWSELFPFYNGNPIDLQLGCNIGVYNLTSKLALKPESHRFSFNCICTPERALARSVLSLFALNMALELDIRRATQVEEFAGQWKS